MTQIPGGWLADRYGGKQVLGYALLSSAILTVLLPVSARTSVYLVCLVRGLMGLMQVYMLVVLSFILVIGKPFICW